MAKYAISVEGATAMRALASQLLTEANAVLEASTALEQKVMSINEGLGIYGDEIIAIIRHGRTTLNANREQTLELANRISEKAKEIDELVSLSAGGSSNGISPCSTTIQHEEMAVNGMAPTRSSPRDLPITQFGFCNDADGNMVYDSPYEMDQYLYKTQGSADANYQGTCGLCSCANILRLAGVNASEKEMIEYASTTRASGVFFQKLCITGNADPGNNGGTSPKSRQLILDHFGIDSGIFPVPHQNDGSISPTVITQVSDMVSQGRGVILSVHADVLWHGLDYGTDDYHAVTVTSVKKDSAGKVLGFYICDSANGGTNYYSAETIRKALTGAPMNVTYPIIR